MKMDIDLKNILNVFQKLGSMRSFSSYILPFCLLLGAFVLFVPSKVLSVKLRKDMEKGSVGSAQKIESLSRKIVSSRQWEVEKEYQDFYAADADKVAKLGKQSTQRELLSYKILPEPNESSVLLFKEFGQKYRAGIEGLIKQLGARQCLTETELERSLQKSVGSSTGSTRRAGRRSRSSQPSKVIEDMIINELCTEVARGASFFVSPVDIPGYEYWGTELQASPGVEIYEYISIKQSVYECWFWQLGYWIIEDIFETTRAMNKGHVCVLDSPVKRIVSVYFASESSLRGSGLKGPSYVYPDKGGLTYPLTKRYTNDDLDIVHFKVSVVLSSDSVLPFMQELCSSKEHKFRGFDGKGPVETFKHNQITILESDIKPVVPEDDEHKLYRYGDDAVVQLDLICEYIFSKEGYEAIKPKWVKEEDTGIQ